MRLLILLLCLTFINNAFGQDEVIVLVITNTEVKISLDGIEKGVSLAGAAFRISSAPGDHYVEAHALVNGINQTKGEIVQLEAGKQKIIKFEFELSTQLGQIDIIPIAEINFNIPGSLEIVSWQSENPDKPYPYPSFYYAFEKGDEIVFDVSMTNEKGTNIIDVSTYPGGATRYTNNAFALLKEVSIKVPERSIYRFTLASNHVFPRNGLLTIKRKPLSKESADFNSHVSFKRILTPVQVTEPQDFFVNSGSNATFKGGKSRVLVPVVLPENTVEWFYRFSASRNTADIENVKSNFGLFGELTKLILNLSGTGAAVTNIGVELLKQPPGADVCDVTLLPYEYGQAFEMKTDDWRYIQEGTRSNLRSGNVRVTCCQQGSYFLGIKNPNSMYGVNVLIEVVAITAKDDYVMEDN